MKQSNIDVVIKVLRKLNESEYSNPLTSENNWDNLIVELTALQTCIADQQSRTKVIIQSILECSAGEYLKKLPVSEKQDDIDSICMAFNVYTEELEAYLNKKNKTETTGKIKQKMKEKTTLKILIAEDNMINQMLISTILLTEGYEIFMADDGKIAVEELEKNDYDIVLMDLMMPNMNGYEASEYIRTKMIAPKKLIPIIAVSADVTKDVKEKCSNVGMNDYISKPYSQKDLIDIIKLHVAC